MKSVLLVKTFWGLVEMTSGLVNASFSLPEWQAVKMIFFAPWFWQKIAPCEGRFKESRILDSSQVMDSRIQSLVGFRNP